MHIRWGPPGRWRSCPDDLRRIDAAALEVLADVGVSIPSERARAGLAARGAAVDGARVRLRPELVRELVALAPPRSRWAPAAANRCHRGALADHDRRLLRRDLRPRERREARHDRRGRGGHRARGRRDARDRLLLAGGQRPGSARRGPRPARALPRPRQHRQARADGHRGRAGDGAVAVAMARALCDGDEARLRAEPPISALLGTVTPLGNDAGTLEAGLEFAAAGIPIGFVRCRWAARRRPSRWPARSSSPSPRR